MSCEQRPGRIAGIAARLGAGIGLLTSKRGFYAGLVVAAAGLSGAGLLGLARRRSSTMMKPNQIKKAATVIRWQDIPQLPPRTKLKPLPVSQLPGSACAGCQSATGGKAGPWYAVNNRPYCRDCAPAAAQAGGVDLVLPSPASGAASPLPSVERRSNRAILDPERRVETQLVPSRLRVRLGEGAGGPRWAVVEQGYVALRPNGLDTGLALTPALLPAGQGGLREDASAWSITHIASGKGLSGPYPSPQAAKPLVDILAQLDWSRSEAEISGAELRQAQATAAAFQQVQAEAKAEAKGQVFSPPSPSPSPPSLPEDLTGQLRADGYGGVSRVLADNGATLLLVDSLGSRYEVNRTQTRRPDEADFELSRVAMSFDPTQAVESRCAGCGRSTRTTGAGEMWYRMGWQSHCESCAPRYAAEEAYIMEEAVGDEWDG